jgi:hypothetical protein
MSESMREGAARSRRGAVGDIAEAVSESKFAALADAAERITERAIEKDAGQFSFLDGVLR